MSIKAPLSGLLRTARIATHTRPSTFATSYTSFTTPKVYSYSTMTLPTTQRIWVVANPNPTQVSTSIFKLEEKPLAKPGADEVLISVDYLSNDPVARLSFNVPGSTPVIAAVGTVLADSGKWKAGDRISSRLQWADYAVVPSSSLVAVSDVPEDKPWAFLSDLGSTALTAYAAKDVLDLKSSDSVLVGGASGAVGAPFVQIAKHVVGAKRVVGVAGGSEKARWVESLGADVCVDYKSPTFAEDLKKALPDGASAFLDPVGGAVFNAALEVMQQNGRIAVAGNIAALNGGNQVIDKPLTLILKGLSIKGFSVRGWLGRAPEIRKEIAGWIREGKVKTDGATEVVSGTIEDVPKTYLKVYDGSKQVGKLITHIEH